MSGSHYSKFVSHAFTLAPSSINNYEIYVLPYYAAHARGVLPYTRSAVSKFYLLIYYLASSILLKYARTCIQFIPIFPRAFKNVAFFLKTLIISSSLWYLNIIVLT